MRTPRIQRYMLIGLAGVWLLLFALRIAAEQPPQEVPLKFTSKGGSPKTAVGQVPMALSVKSLHSSVGERRLTPTRNIFAVGASPTTSEMSRSTVRRKKESQPIEAAMVPPPPPPGPSPEEVAEEQARQQRELKLKQLKEQMGQYRYLGYLAQDGDRKAFLGKGHEIYIIRQGDKLDGKFQVAVVEPSIVKIRDADSSLETTIQLKKEGSGETS